jgi:hypothetical protein
MFHQFSALTAGFITGTGDFWNSNMAARAELEDEWQGTASGAQRRREIRQNVIGPFQPIKHI